ncbi:MAG TPA: molecular chaperone HtpG [Bacteroidales bacterium]|nr:molecular chaperone HtpG [Bacteroidales bacterium]HRZ49596.1 molecular chaperone HtpG [Bacteroidales bacterium]
MVQGKINVQTENIFPIIKKFLYSDHEIFLRELVSNAVDATQKLKALASLGTFKGEMGDLTIRIKIDREQKTLTVSDAGIGMTAEEVEKYINQIAFSSAEEFLKKFKNVDASTIIGHFGLGFYSSFMVADRVDLNTKTYKKGGGTKAVKWSCDGSPDYTMEESDRSARGTDVILHIAEDSVEFLEEQRILTLLKKYCRFLPVPIEFGTESYSEKIEGEKDEHGHDKYETRQKPRIINNTNPLWKKAPVDLKDGDYLDFYRELYPMQFEEPLFNIHLNVDYPFNLTGILYFPKVKNNFEVQRDKIQLYSNQVFITDSVEGVVPDFLTLLHGVIDSPDIPLNVSRSYLQSDANVKKISGHISKKVADKLEEIFSNRRDEFEQKWDDIRIFIIYGMLTDEKFAERAMKFILLKNTQGKYFTPEEYKNHISGLQTDKDQKLVCLYASDADAQHTYLEDAKERGYDVLLLDGPLDNHFVNLLEQKLENARFTRVDADVMDKLIDKADQMPSKLSEEEQKQLREFIEKTLDNKEFIVQFESLNSDAMPMIITRPEFMRRMKDMQMLGGGMQAFGMFPDSYNLVVNLNHPLVEQLSASGTADETREKLIRQLFDLALLSQNLLKGEKLTTFVKRSVELIG